MELTSLDFADRLLAAIRTRFFIADEVIDADLDWRATKSISGGSANAQFYQCVVALIFQLLSSSCFYIVGKNSYTQEQPYQGENPRQGLGIYVDVDYVMQKVGNLEIPAAGDLLIKQYPSLENFIQIFLDCTNCVSSSKYIHEEALGTMYSASLPQYVDLEDDTEQFFGNGTWEGVKGVSGYDGDIQRPIPEKKYYDSINQVYYTQRKQVLFNPVPMLFNYLSLAYKTFLQDAQSQKPSICGNTYMTLVLDKGYYDHVVTAGGSCKYSIMYEVRKQSIYFPNFTTYEQIRQSFDDVHLHFYDYTTGFYHIKNTSPFDVQVYGSAYLPEPNIRQESQESQFQSSISKSCYGVISPRPPNTSFVKVDNCKNLRLLSKRDIGSQSYVDISSQASMRPSSLFALSAPVQITGSQSPPLDTESPDKPYTERYYVQIWYEQTLVSFVKYNIPF